MYTADQTQPLQAATSIDSQERSRPLTGDHPVPVAHTTREITSQRTSSGTTNQMLHPEPSLMGLDLSTTQFDDTASLIMNDTNSYHENHGTGLYSSMPVNYSTINWLGFEDGHDLNGSMAQEWQYPDHLFNLYVPASDTYSLSQVSQSPTAYRNVENVAGDSSARFNTGSTPWDVDTTSAMGTNETVSTPGKFYVDGGTARLPRMRKRRAMSSYAIQEHSNKAFSLALPSDLSFTSPDHEYINAQDYADLQSHYSNVCISTTTPFAPFDTAEFPPRDLFNYLCTVFVQNCSSVLPFLHVATLKLRRQHWLLSVSMAATGSHYLKSQDGNRFVLSLHEVVRRLLFLAVETSNVFHMDFNTQYRVTLLHTIGSAYCGERSLRDHALSLQLKLASLFLEGRVDEKDTTLVTADRTEAEWHRWIDQESSLRLRHYTLLLDCILGFQFQTRPILSLRDAMLPIPADDKSWNAATALEWSQLTHGKSKLPELVICLDELYVSKKIREHTGEFARILLIYGLHRRLSEVESFYSQRLSHWAPNRQNLPESTTLPDLPIWLPSLPMFKKWQNLTCDSLDVLHWTANATIGEASGFEHPTVLHLHLARVVLLTPIREIVNLARYLAGERGSKPEAEVMTDRQAVHRWAIQHQYKARLAAIHAGVVFWHVRRFSANAFYEPTAVAHAALVLWAFSAFSSKTASSADMSGDGYVHCNSPSMNLDVGHVSSDSESSSDTIILLDRPADDEIVQEFVMNGPRMRANMTGVGDLYGEKGPERVLREGSKILRTLSCWRAWETWAKVLDRLVTLSKRERKRNKEVTVLDNAERTASGTRPVISN